MIPFVMTFQKRQNYSNREQSSVYQELGGREELTPCTECEGTLLHSDYGDNNMNLYIC